VTDTPALFAVVVTFRLSSDGLAPFLRLVTENARLSAELEADCVRFDVLRPATAAPDIVALYELYRTAEAFADHLTRPHFLRFDAEAQDYVIEKSVARFWCQPNP